jgi:pimeloyl-ACP methyl ester carboxylesterase
MLHAAGVPPPYVLVGSSFSGFNVRAFAGKYPSEVAEVILVDSAHEDQYRYEPRATLAPVNRLPRHVRNLLCAVIPLAARVGVVRLLLQNSQPPRNIPAGFTAEQAATYQGLEMQTKSFLAGAVCNYEETVSAQMRAAGYTEGFSSFVASADASIAIGWNEPVPGDGISLPLRAKTF